MVVVGMGIPTSFRVLARLPSRTMVRKDPLRQRTKVCHAVPLLWMDG